MRTRKDVVLADSRRVAQSVMETDWAWTPQRVRDALIITNKGQLALMRQITNVAVYVAGDYPSTGFTEIFEALLATDAFWGNPFAGDTMVNLKSRSAQRAS